MTLPDIVTWAEQHFYVGKNKCIQLQPIQKTVLREMFRQDQNGRFIYRDGLYSTIKKSGKTTIAALIMKWACMTWGEDKEIYHIANKLTQARGRAFKLVKQSIKWGGTEADWEMKTDKLTYKANGSFIQALPVNASGEAGAHQCLTTWTEAHGFVYEANVRMWEEMQPIPTEPISFRLMESYAGYKGESNLLEAVWERAKAGQQVHDEYPIYANGRLIAYIDEGVRARRMPWQTPDYYQDAEASSTPNEFARIHLNEWVDAQGAFVEIALWDGLVVARVPDEKLTVVLGVDASVSGDCSAVVAVGMVNDLPTELETVIFEPPKKGTLDYSITIEPTIRRMMTQYQVVGVAYDPYQMHDLMTRLRMEYAPYDEQHAPQDQFFHAFSQQNARLKADNDLLSRIRQKRMRHRGNPTLREHVQNADQKAVTETAIRIVKRNSGKPIDGLVALSMALWRLNEIMGNVKQITIDDDTAISDLLDGFRG